MAAMKKTIKTKDGKLYVISGASRSGKTWFTTKEATKAKRVIAWDPEDQWAELPGFVRITKKADLLKAVQKRGPAKIAYVAGGNLTKQFDYFCGCAFYWGRYCGPCNVIGEELADVSTPNKAPGNWGILLRRGLKRGISIYAISQRWAEADKTAIGNATEFIIFRSVGDDARYMSRKTGVSVESITGMKQLDFVRYCTATGRGVRGRMQ